MKLFVLSTLVAAALMGGTLQNDATKAGLKPIPASKAALTKLTSNPKNPTTAAKVELGKMLYMDPRLSKSGLISCNTCHNVGLGGSDGMGAAIGHK
ncbi:MAG TPA: cytochrome c peroxidase, partial [Sulfuricurvum sp.]|nr:cytochrome c peroxidase [Sulfuricurvum sp.]HQT37544.1 cytochrome c peroxidase [Sulfuricurvum sp.]